MAEGRIAGNVTVVTRPEIKGEQPSQGIDTPIEVSLDVLRFFNADFNADSKTMSKLKDVSDWAFEEVGTLGDGLLKLKHLEIKLGQPNGSDSRLDKIHRWILLQRHINDLRKRQESL